MLNFFKVFGLGILYIVTLPLTVTLLAVYAIYCLLAFIYVSLRNIIVFFSGGTINGDLPEDIEAKRILMQRKEKEEMFSSVIQNMYVNKQTSNPMPFANNTQFPQPNIDIYQEISQQNPAQNSQEEVKEENNYVDINQVNRE